MNTPTDDEWETVTKADHDAIARRSLEDENAALLARASQAEQERDAWVVLHDLVKAERDRLLIEAGESLDLTGRVLDFEIVAEPEETEK